MNILIVVPWDQEYGGVASVVGNLGTYFRDQGHKVIFFHYGKSDSIQYKTTKWGFDAVDLNMRPPFFPDNPLRGVLAFIAFFPSTFYQIRALIRKSNIDVVNIHFPGDGFIYFAIYRWLCRGRLVVSVHGADFFPDGKEKPVHSLASRVILRAADALVAPSRAFMQDIVRIFPSIRRKAGFIHNGINLKELSHQCERDPDVDESLEKYILCVAYHNEKKGIDILIDAFARVRDAEPNLKLKLVGDGPLRKEMEERVHSLRLDDRVEFLGERGRADVVRLLYGCEIFVLPSRSEPFGIAMIEAMACKKPVVACAVGGVPEVIQNGKNGILVCPNNPPALAEALLGLLKNSELRQSIAQNGYNSVQACFRSDTMGARYERMFASLLSSKSGSLDSEGDFNSSPST